MTTNPTDNAFPVHSVDLFDGSPIGTTHHGLSKREHFAALAMQGLLSNPGNTCRSTLLALDAIRAADALISELSRPTES